MSNNHHISNNTYNLSTPPSRQVLQNSHNVTNMRAGPSSDTENRISANKNSHYNKKNLHVPNLPGENSFQDNTKEAKSDIQTIPQQLACDYNNDHWLKHATKIIETANRPQKIFFNKKKHDPEAALHKVAQPLTKFKTIAPRHHKHSPETTTKTNSPKNNGTTKTLSDKGTSNLNRSQERYILPKISDSSSITNSTKTSEKYTNACTSKAASNPHSQSSSSIEHCINLVDSLTTINPSKPTHSRPTISPRSSSDKLPYNSVVRNYATTNIVLLKSEKSSTSQPSSPPSKHTSPNFHASGPGQNYMVNNAPVNSDTQSSKIQSTQYSSTNLTDPLISSKPKTDSDVIVISYDNESDLELVTESDSFTTHKTNNLNSSDSVQYKQAPTLQTTELVQVKKVPTSNEGLSNNSKSKAEQRPNDNHTIELAQAKQAPSSDGELKHISKLKADQLIKSEYIPSVNGIVAENPNFKNEVVSKKPTSDKNITNPSDQSHDNPSVLKKAKTSLQKHSLLKHTSENSTLLTSSSNLAQHSNNKKNIEDPVRRKMVCKKSTSKSRRKNSIISKAIDQVNDTNKDNTDELTLKNKTYALKSGPKNSVPKPNITIKYKTVRKTKTNTKAINKDTNQVEEKTDVTTALSVEISKTKELQLPSPKSTTVTEADSTTESLDPNDPKPLYIKLDDIPIIYEETEEAAYIERDFEIECIIGRRHNTGRKQKQYLVKWRGYHVNLSTWVDSSELGCSDLIRAFNLSMESKKGGKTSRIADETKKEQFLPDELEKFLILLNNDDDAAISVVNDVDNAKVPNFTYINSLVLHPDVILDPNEASFIASCNCSKMCKPVNSSTAQKNCLESHDPYSYLIDGSLYNSQNNIIYECNSKCKCNLKCTNRVIQRGRTIELQIFRTKYKGWGVRTLQDIPKGRFVCKYTGLVITSDHADMLGMEYDKRGSTYLFDLDANTSEEKSQDLCIDANSYGNLSRFINHSCSPNLGVYCIVTDSLSVYDISFFAVRAIKKGEEIFIDYSGGELTNLEDKMKASKCYCMASNCKGYIYM